MSVASDCVSRPPIDTVHTMQERDQWGCGAQGGPSGGACRVGVLERRGPDASFDASASVPHVALGPAGLASTALGAVFLYRDRNVPVVPIATVADHHVLVSLGGAF